MISTNKIIKGNPHTAQRCPMCNMLHPIHVKGLVYADETMTGFSQTADRGYSFCNCRNIFFTDWKNIDQTLYNHDYSQKYNDEKTMLKDIATERAEIYLGKLNGEDKVFVEIGSANPYALDVASRCGFVTVGFDINPKSVKHPTHMFYSGDIESDDTINNVPSCDVIWASHVFEHFHYPLKVAKMCFDKLNSDGLLLVSMPDPWIIPWQNPKNWGNWVIREHHIMWDMDSFIDELILIGFEFVDAKRNYKRFIGSGDYTITMRKP